MAIELGTVKITLFIVIVGAKLNRVVCGCWWTTLFVLEGEGDGVTEGGLVIAIKLVTVARHDRAGVCSFWRVDVGAFWTIIPVDMQPRRGDEILTVMLCV